MWPFTTKKSTITETRELGRKLNDIIFELENVKKNVKDEITLNAVNELQATLNTTMADVKVKDFKKCSEILNMIQESVQDLNPLLTISGDNTDIQIRFISNLLDDYWKGESNFLENKKFREIYNERRDLLKTLTKNLQTIHRYEVEKETAINRGQAAAQNNKLEEAESYIEKVKRLKNLINQQKMNSKSAMDTINEISITLDSLIAQKTMQKQNLQTTKKIHEIAIDSLESADRDTYATTKIREQTANEYIKKQSNINDRISSQNTLSNALDKVSSTNEFSRKSQKIEDEKVLNDTSDLKARQEKVMEELKKLSN